jgi:hypothetical protein
MIDSRTIQMRKFILQVSYLVPLVRSNRCFLERESLGPSQPNVYITVLAECVVLVDAQGSYPHPLEPRLA